ncbi:MAG: terpene cyclase/mutase family protein [Planctomycetes bacterium]|nr:terpene cyclase/mutase family protein [Planctomycetota bacterium]
MNTRSLFKWGIIPLLLVMVVAGVYLFRDPTLGLMIRAGMGIHSESAPRRVSGPVDRGEICASMKAASAYLLAQQNAKGAWLDHPGFSAITLHSLHGALVVLGGGKEDKLSLGADYLLSLQQGDGSFVIPFSISSAMRNYTTSLALKALVSFDLPVYAAAIEKARNFLLNAQNDEKAGYSPGESGYGGLGYAPGGGADLSNLQVALDALKGSGLPDDHPFFKKAEAFVTSCQDGEGNGSAWVRGSGGFVYSPDAVGGEGPEVYGAMGFAGLKSLIFCEVDREDPRLQEALEWIGRNYSVDRHPGKGQVSLYYYYYVMASTLSAAGIDAVETPQGRRDWRRELAGELLARQNKDGSWANPEGKYMEGIPVLATAYALNALTRVLEGWEAVEASP